MSCASKWRSFWVGVVVAACAGLPVVGWAAEATTPAKKAYLKYCSACHGESGKGDGVVSGFMTPRPTDLTQMAKQSGGHLQQGKLRQSIDGTTTVRAHGDPDMPVWGEILHAESTAPLHEQAEPRGKLMLITDYIESIQVQ
jgi:hypothetical protein